MAVINGTAFDDVLTGAAEDDIINAGDGNDNIDGGLGTDTARFNYTTAEIASLTGSGASLTINGAEGVDTIVNVESLQFSNQTVSINQVIVGASGDDVLSGSSAADLISANSGNDTINAGDGFDRIWAGLGVNTIDGGGGDDTVVFDYSSSSIISVSSANGQQVITSGSSTDTLSNVEYLQFTDQIVEVSRLILGTASAQTVNGTDNADVIAAGAGADTINAGAGDDLIVGAEDGETIDGGSGSDTVKFNFSQNDLTQIIRKLNGDLQLVTEQPTTLLTGVESIAFSDQAVVTVDALLSSFSSGAPLFYLAAQAESLGIVPEAYTGPVTFLEYELFGDATSNVVTGAASNDFINLLDGNDAAAGGDGQDVLDGGTGSNFLTGGNGSDTFFLDGRGGSVTWSTITDFTSGDNVNIWGWDTASQLILTEELNGADGYQGVTLHYDLNGDGTIETSITFTGLSEQQLPTGEVKEVGGEGYLLFT